jgi:hypothetical protein
MTIERIARLGRDRFRNKPCGRVPAAPLDPTAVGGSITLRLGFALLLLIPAAAHAGTAYVLTHRGLQPHGAPRSVALYFVENGKVSAVGADSATVYLFEQGKVFVVDNSAKSIQVASSATVDRAERVMDQRAKLLGDSAAQYPPDRRAVLEKMAADMKARNDIERLPPSLVQSLTDRTEVVDGRSCHIWEASEWNAKRFEFCVAEKTAIAGSSEILSGMRTLDQYWQGSLFAVGVNIGNSGWWPGIAELKGVPILIREFRNGKASSETTLTEIRDGVRGSFDLPSGYPLTEVSLIP